MKNTLYLYQPECPEGGEPEPEVYTCDICGFEFIKGWIVTFKIYAENVCDECYSDPDYIEIITQKYIQKIERLN